MLGFYDIVIVFWHADLPIDEPILVIPPKWEEAICWGWQMRKTINVRHAASLPALQGVHGNGVDYQTLAISRQMFYSPRFDSLAAHLRRRHHRRGRARIA